jgi:hypothetical protein
MTLTRAHILLGAAFILLIALIWHWLAGWGLVTVHVQNTPLSRVISSIERQGGIKLVVTGADDGLPITMDVDRVPVAEAVDTLAAHLEGNWNVTYVAGPSKAAVSAAVAVLRQGDRSPDYQYFGTRGFGGGGMDMSDTVIDPRKIAWNVSPADKQDLQSYLDELTIKTGIEAMAPQTWNPSLSRQPGGGAASSAVRNLVHSVGGQVQEVFTIHVWQTDQTAGGPPQGARPSGSDGGFGRAGGGGHPEWMEERMTARIDQLPKNEKEQAKKDINDMRAQWLAIRALPADQRQAAMQKLFDDPNIQQRISDRMAARDDKRSPEKRADFLRRYIARKQAILSGQNPQTGPGGPGRQTAPQH